MTRWVLGESGEDERDEMPRKLALVTGASGGLGLEFAKLLAADGYDLALVARSGEQLVEIARELGARHNVEALPIVADLATLDAADALVAKVPRCDVLINNAGFATNERFDRIAESRITQEIVLDVLTLTRLTRKYLPAMIEQHDGKILNVASTAGLLPGPFMAVYYACKAYVISFSQAITEELRGTGVTVSCFAPGSMETGFAARANAGETLLFSLPLSNAATMAKAGYRGLLRGKALNIPWPPSNWLVDLSARLTPRRILIAISRKAVERKE
jgi:uncharacterized protein